MKKTLYILPLLGLIALTFSSCKKYEDGPAITLRTVKSRIVGEWKVTKYAVAGQDVLQGMQYGSQIGYCTSGDYFTYTMTEKIDEMIFDFQKDGEYDLDVVYSNSTINYNASMAACSAIYETQTESESESGEWELKDGKEELKISSDYGATIRFEIVQLTKDEMKLEGDFGGEKIEMELKAND